jgi:hypothetical protein
MNLTMSSFEQNNLLLDLAVFSYSGSICSWFYLTLHFVSEISNKNKKNTHSKNLSISTVLYVKLVNNMYRDLNIKHIILLLIIGTVPKLKYIVENLSAF